VHNSLYCFYKGKVDVVRTMKTCWGIKIFVLVGENTKLSNPLGSYMGLQQVN
jgi:hypothetical protein